MTDRRRGLVLLLAVALLWGAFYVLGEAYAGFALGLGSNQEPTRRHLVFLTYFVFFGAAGVVLLAPGLLAVARERFEWEGWEERRFLVAAALLALLIPVALRSSVLAGAPVTDDESLYRFMAELLASGRVTAPSHPWKLFFDHAFLVNDGQMYSQYFLGWPAFLAVGVALGVPGLVNAVLSAATVPALYLVVRDLAGRVWAQVATLLFLASPMLQLLAATGLSHTAALAALTWTAYFALRVRREPDMLRFHALVALAFSVAFFVRPLTALGIGGPLLWLWLRAWMESPRRVKALVAFAVPSVAMAALFLAVNRAQTGELFQPAYMAWQEYARANAFRFSGLTADRAPEVPNLVFQGWGIAVKTAALGLVRLNFALLGWPSAFLFLPFALLLRGSGTGVFWASIGVFLLLHVPLKDTGIDTIGPVHFTELALPVLVLSAVGMRRLADWLERRGEPGRPAVLATVTSLVACGLLLYAPHRLGAVSTVATLVTVPDAVTEVAGVENAVIFTPVPYALGCNPAIDVPSQPYVFWWPLNDPDFENSVLRANHLSVEMDRRLMQEHFPDRSGWIARWDAQCRLELVPLDRADPEAIPNGRMVIYATRSPMRYDERHPPTGEVPPGFRP